MRGRTVPQPAAGRGGAVRAAAPRPAPPRGPRPPPGNTGTRCGSAHGRERGKAALRGGCGALCPSGACRPRGAELRGEAAGLGSCRLGAMRFEGAAVSGRCGFRALKF